MAFIVDPEDLLEFRGTLQALMERADADAWTKMWRKQWPAYAHRLKRVRWRVPKHLVQKICDLVLPLPGQPKPPILAELIRSEPSTIDFCPNPWFAIADTARSVGNALEDAGATPMAEPVINMKKGILADLLSEWQPNGACQYKQIDEWDCSTVELGWVRQLRYRPEGSSEEFSKPTDLWTDTVIGFPGADFDVQPFRVIAEIRNALGFDGMLEALVGPFVLSRGPGPFLPIPAAASPIQNPSWNILPLFRETRLLDVWTLEAEEIAETLANIRHAKPDRDWHQAHDVRMVPKRVWEGLIKNEWPRLQARYIELLAEAQQFNRTVLFTLNDFGHPVWIGSNGVRVEI
jgi:hypothetical protein